MKRQRTQDHTKKQNYLTIGIILLVSSVLFISLSLVLSGCASFRDAYTKAATPVANSIASFVFMALPDEDLSQVEAWRASVVAGDVDAARAAWPSVRATALRALAALPEEVRRILMHDVDLMDYINGIGANGAGT